MTHKIGKFNKAQKTIIEGILKNEKCRMCGKNVEQKCLTCMLNNQPAGYCPHHHTEPFHKAQWISVLE